jgi:hypothetical protein
VRQVRKLALATLLATAWATTLAAASPDVRLRVRLTPKHLGHGTTIGFTVWITTPDQGVPPPLTEIDLAYPRSLGIAVSGLGFDTCSQTTLEIVGPRGCPAESRMGQGTAIAEVPVGHETVDEKATATIIRAPAAEGQIAMFFNVESWSPLIAQLVLPAILNPAPPPNEESLDIKVPLLESFAGGADISVIQLHATLGPRGITYYEHLHGKLVPYKPRGILLPKHCPRHGFAFTAKLSFTDATASTSHTVVPCPRPA